MWTHKPTMGFYRLRGLQKTRMLPSDETESENMSRHVFDLIYSWAVLTGWRGWDHWVWPMSRHKGSDRMQMTFDNWCNFGRLLWWQDDNWLRSTSDVLSHCIVLEVNKTFRYANPGRWSYSVWHLGPQATRAHLELMFEPTYRPRGRDLGIDLNLSKDN
jgi:hypothetical protein